MRSHDRANAKATEWATRLIDRIGPEEAARLSASMLASIDEVSQHRWEHAKRRAAATPGTIRPEKIGAITTAFSRELGAAGSSSRILRRISSCPARRSSAGSNGSAPVSISYRITPSE